MPCNQKGHIHKWTTSGNLIIAKCESRCDFCGSAKEYKPAAALRKHVARHIENDNMRVKLVNAKGGRPKLRTTIGIRTDLRAVPYSGKCSLEQSEDDVSDCDPSLSATTTNGGLDAQKPSAGLSSTEGNFSDHSCGAEITMARSSPLAKTPPVHNSPIASPNNIQTCRDDDPAPSGPLPRCWRCEVLNLDCTRQAPCTGCIDSNHSDGCSQLPTKSSARHLLPCQGVSIEIHADDRHILQWRNDSFGTLNIELGIAENRCADVVFDNDLGTARQLQAYTTWLLTRAIPDVPLCLARSPMGDPRSYLWRGIAADVINAAVFYSLRKTQILDYPEDEVIVLGLKCLALSLTLLREVHRVVGLYGCSPSSDLQDANVRVNCGSISQINSSIETFLWAMRGIAFQAPFAEESANHLTHFYAILLLYLIRCALRSAFQYAEHGFEPYEAQMNQDAFFTRGIACPIYQPNLAVLEASKMTIAETWPRKSTNNEKKDKQDKWLSTQYQRAAKLLAMPDGQTKTLAEHLQYSINRWLDQ